MVDSEIFYSGGHYGFDSDFEIEQAYGVSSGYGAIGYQVPAGQIGFPSDPRTANQLDAVSKRLSTGAKVIEVSGVNISGGEGEGAHMSLLNAIPKNQFDEIRRLKELTGAELTFHGPLVELSGFRGGSWEEVDRLRSEREMLRAVEEGQRLNPKGNTPIVFHTTNLPHMEEKHWDKKAKKEITTEAIVINKATGVPERFRMPKPDYFKGAKVIELNQAIEERNKQVWDQSLSRLSFGAFQAQRIIEEELNQLVGESKRVKLAETEKEEENKKILLDYYKKYVTNPAEAEDYLEKVAPKDYQKKFLQDAAKIISHGETYLKGSYQELKELYNQAYAVAKEIDDKESLNKLDEYRKRIAQKVEMYEKDPSLVREFAEEITNGVSVLRKVHNPEIYEPMNNFLIDKSSETISNVAIKSFDKFKNNAPIIALENPPADRYALSRAEDIRNLIENSRKKFIEKATAPKDKGGLGLSKSEADFQAKKLIGATWDTGHINAMQAYGYTKEDVIKEAKKIAPYVKHVHVVDNFGLTDTELPVGMGTAPIKEQLEIFDKYNKQAKKIMETGDWYTRLGMRSPPVSQSFSALGSQIYPSAAVSPYWSQVFSSYGSYFSGLGPINPEQHHNMYGAGFANLPVELGGQVAGGRSRVSGNAME